MNVGDIVTDDRSHMDKSNLFYDAWLRLGLVVDIRQSNPTIATVIWYRSGKVWETNQEVSKLEVISECR